MVDRQRSLRTPVFTEAPARPVSRRLGIATAELQSIGALGRASQPTIPVESSPTRDLRLDFFRGLALLLIFIDHIPENILRYFTLQSVQFFDAAEIFIFISGYTAALVYGRVLATRGPLYAGALVWRRAWQLYVAHIFIFVIFIAEVSYTVRTFNNPMYNEEMRVGEFLAAPHIAVIEALLLQFQPKFLDILPLYIVLLLIFPVVLVALRRWPLFVAVGSLSLYVIVQVGKISVPAYPPGQEWYFNPLAWQFLFVGGAVLGLDKKWKARLLASKPALWAAAAVVLAALVVRLSWTIHGLWDPFDGLFLARLWPVDKTDLSPIRLVPFFAAIALGAALIPPGAGFLRARLSKPLVLCGRHSLEIFCLGILLSVLGHFILSEYDPKVPLQLGVNIVGLTVMVLTAQMIDWYRQTGRMELRPADPTSRRQ